MFFHCDASNLVNFHAELARVNQYGFPNAVRTALNRQAFDTSQKSRDGLKNLFTIRNQYTARSIMMDRATQREIKDMVSHAGSVQEYMAKQDTGFTRRTAGKHGIPLPTPGTSGEKGVSKRLKRMLRRNYLNNLRPISAHGSNWPMTANFNLGRGGVALAARAAIEEGTRVIFIDKRRDHYHRTTGLYRVFGGHLNNPHQRGLWPSGARLQLLYSMSRKRTVTKSHDWLRPHARAAAERIDDYYYRALEDELRKSKERFG